MARGLKSVHLSIPIPDKEKAGNIASLSSPSPPQRKNPFQNIELGGDANGAGGTPEGDRQGTHTA